jgi:importin subunit beta-1
VWNSAAAAGTCISMIATLVGDEILRPLMPFIEENINSTNWKHKEASILAFGLSPARLLTRTYQISPLIIFFFNQLNRRHL